jgi:type I restriction enzyme S subunit
MIPKEWKKTTVGRALNIKNNKRKPLSREERALIPGSYPYYGPTKVQDYISEYNYDGTFALIGEDGDHFLKYKTENMTQLVSGRFNVNNHAHVLSGTKVCAVEWFYFYFQRKSISEALTRQGAKRYKLTKAALEKLEIVLPPLVEQNRIVQILSTWDQAIETVDALIANARAEKAALMERLLTGRLRLEGASGLWTIKRIDEISTRVTSRNDGSNLPVLTIASTSGFVRQDEKYSRFMAGKSVESYILLRRGEFAYNKGNSKTYQYGCVFDLENYECALVPHVYVCFKLKAGYSHRFYKALFEADYLGPQLGRLVNTGVRNNGLLNITPSQFLACSVPVPPPAEQEAIAAIMEASAEALRGLERQFAALKAEKSALMQQLLTGKRRVKLPESEMA